MGLPWFRMETGFHQNPKILELVSAGKWRAVVVWQASIGYSVAQGTDGLVRDFVLQLIHGRPIDARDLVAVGLWHKCEGGWVVNGYEEFQQTTITTERIRDARTLGAAKGNCIRWHGKGCGCWRRLSAVSE